MRFDFFHPIVSNDIKLYAIIGNHDTFYKNTNEVNSMTEIYEDRFASNIEIISRPREVEIDGCKIVLMPWICQDTHEDSMSMIRDTTAQVLFGHLELRGFEMYRGQAIDHGDDPAVFNKFDVVCSGHFHHRSSKGNIHYLGCPYEMTWSDYNDPKGFHVFDTDTRELTFIENPYKMFYKVVYDDSAGDMNAALDVNIIGGTYVKVIVKNKTNPYWFDMFIDKLEKSGAHDIQVVDDHHNLNLEDDGDIVDEAEDTVTIMKKYIDKFNLSVDKTELSKVVQSLYDEALTIE
jgi:DNA repair exonuclease SbcCD nuclease subunit